MHQQRRDGEAGAVRTGVGLLPALLDVPADELLRVLLEDVVDRVEEVVDVVVDDVWSYAIE